MNERRIGALLLSLLVGGIAGGFGSANLLLAESNPHGKTSDATPRKPAGNAEAAKPVATRDPVRK
jgi:hypothetical protein